jgi:RNA-binding protein YlmH
MHSIKWYQEQFGALPGFDEVFNEAKTFLGQQRPVLTDFLQTSQLAVLKQMCPGQVRSFGGYSTSEKQRAFITPDYFDPKAADFNVALFEIDYPRRFARLSHSQILGSLANSGVETSTFGDIVTDGAGQWQFFAEKELTAFFTQQITRIGKAAVKVRSVPLAQLLPVFDDSQSFELVVASLRLDALVGKLTGLPRSRAKAMISQGLVQVNFLPSTRPDAQAELGSTLSIRHYGRWQLQSVQATRKGRLRIAGRAWLSHHN